MTKTKKVQQLITTELHRSISNKKIKHISSIIQFWWYIAFTSMSIIFILSKIFLKDIF